MKYTHLVHVLDPAVSLLVLLTLLNLFLLLGENRERGLDLDVVVFSVVVVVVVSSPGRAHSHPFFLRSPHFCSTMIPVSPSWPGRLLPPSSTPMHFCHLKQDKPHLPLARLRLTRQDTSINTVNRRIF